jgi:hypothetical protein
MYTYVHIVSTLYTVYMYIHVHVHVHVASNMYMYMYIIRKYLHILSPLSHYLYSSLLVHHQSEEETSPATVRTSPAHVCIM